MGYDESDKLRARFHIHTRTSSAVPFEGFGRESAELAIGQTESLSPGTLHLTGAKYKGINLENTVTYCLE